MALGLRLCLLAAKVVNCFILKWTKKFSQYSPYFLSLYYGGHAKLNNTVFLCVLFRCVNNLREVEKFGPDGI